MTNRYIFTWAREEFGIIVTLFDYDPPDCPVSPLITSLYSTDDMDDAHDFIDAYTVTDLEVIEIHPMMIAGCVGYHDLSPQNVADYHQIQGHKNG